MKTQARREHDAWLYDAAWRKVSAQARAIQRFCSDCGTTDDLTTDHTPEAWKAKRAGKPITLAMLDVVCRRCNAKRGPGEGRDVA